MKDGRFTKSRSRILSLNRIRHRGVGWGLILEGIRHRGVGGLMCCLCGTGTKLDPYSGT